MRMFLKVLKTAITSTLLKRNRDLKNIPQEAYEYFRDITPIRTGNARRKTKLQNDAIVADYPYGKRLDEGYSPQAPRGMSKPTIEHIGEKVKIIFK
jgi:tRNA G10  N-methylase Trm11